MKQSLSLLSNNAIDQSVLDENRQLDSDFQTLSQDFRALNSSLILNTSNVYNKFVNFSTPFFEIFHQKLSNLSNTFIQRAFESNHNISSVLRDRSDGPDLREVVNMTGNLLDEYQKIMESLDYQIEMVLGGKVAELANNTSIQSLKEAIGQLRPNVSDNVGIRQIGTLTGSTLSTAEKTVQAAVTNMQAGLKENLVDAQLKVALQQNLNQGLASGTKGSIEAATDILLDSARAKQLSQKAISQTVAERKAQLGKVQSFLAAGNQEMMRSLAASSIEPPSLVTGTSLPSLFKHLVSMWDEWTGPYSNRYLDSLEKQNDLLEDAILPQQRNYELGNRLINKQIKQTGKALSWTMEEVKDAQKLRIYFDDGFMNDTRNAIKQIRAEIQAAIQATADAEILDEKAAARDLQIFVNNSISQIQKFPLDLGIHQQLSDQEVPAVGNQTWLYAGCFEDSNFPFSLGNASSPAECIALAQNSSYHTIGLQPQGECRACNNCSYDTSRSSSISRLEYCKSVLVYSLKFEIS